MNENCKLNGIYMLRSIGKRVFFLCIESVTHKYIFFYLYIYTWETLSY